jgi:hypothetical protein
LAPERCKAKGKRRKEKVKSRRGVLFSWEERLKGSKGITALRRYGFKALGCNVK